MNNYQKEENRVEADNTAQPPMPQWKMNLKSINPIPVVAAVPTWFVAHGLTSLFRLPPEEVPTYAQWWAEVTGSRVEALFWLIGCVVIGVGFGVARGRQSGR